MQGRTGWSVRIAVAALMAALLLPARVEAETQSTPPSGSSEPSATAGQRAAAGAAIGFDLVVLRPLGLAATAVGAALFVPIALVSVANGASARNEAWEMFVAGPAEYVFTRPLGDF